MEHDFKFDHTKEDITKAMGISDEDWDRAVAKFKEAVDAGDEYMSQTLERIFNTTDDAHELSLITILLYGNWKKASSFSSMLGVKPKCDDPNCKACHPETAVKPEP